MNKHHMDTVMSARKLLESATPQEREVLSRGYGIEPYEFEQTIDEISEAMGLSEREIITIANKAKDSLTSRFSKESGGFE